MDDLTIYKMGIEYLPVKNFPVIKDFIRICDTDREMTVPDDGWKAIRERFTDKFG